MYVCMYVCAYYVNTILEQHACMYVCMYICMYVCYVYVYFDDWYICSINICMYACKRTLEAIFVVEVGVVIAFKGVELSDDVSMDNVETETVGAVLSI